jgi:hypothetical protein
MQFLDAIGLASFWEKIKNWANSNFFSKRGGEIHPKIGLQYTIDGEQLSITKSGEGNETISIFNVDENRMEAISIVKSGGTATQVLMADGSVKTLNASNGIAGLDSKGNVPLSQLGNLDTTVAEVVTTLPTANIKKHIYLIKDTNGVTQDKYEEYIYTGDTSATYDASKWEKLGDFRATVDLANYAKKNEAIFTASIIHNSDSISLNFTDRDEKSLAKFDIEAVTGSTAGVMIPSDKKKLDGIANNANNYSLPTASSTIKGGITLGYSQNGKNYPVALDSNGKAYVNVPWIDTNTTYGLATSTNDGLMKASDKAKIDSIDTTYAKKREAATSLEITPYENDIQFVLKSIDRSEIDWPSLDPATSTKAGIMTSKDKVKLDGIASGATADSAIPTSVIDALN